MSKILAEYIRPQAQALGDRLLEPRRFIQVLAGPRQVGKTTVVRQVGKTLGLPFRYASADEPGLRGAGWIAQQWEAARLAADGSDAHGAVLALDEIRPRSPTILSCSQTRAWLRESRNTRAMLRGAGAPARSSRS